LSVIGIKSPGTGGIAIIVAAILGVIAVSAFFISRSLRDFQFPEINLPGLPDITFPSFPDITFPSFPDITFPSFPEINFPEFPTIEFPSFFREEGEPASFGPFARESPGGQPIAPGLAGGLQERQRALREGQDPDEPQGPGFFEQFPFAGSIENVLGRLGDMLTPAQAFAQERQGPRPDLRFIAEAGPEPIDPQVQTTLDTGQQFFGGGTGFIGGFVTETPIEFLSLNQIIEMGLASSASEAASLRAEARGFTPEEEAFLNQGPVDVGGFIGGGPPAVSDPQFEGLTPEEIALRLTGGPISNF